MVQARPICQTAAKPKKMLGPSSGAAIKLSSDDEIGIGLGIAEGIETALSLLVAGWHPCGQPDPVGELNDSQYSPGSSASPFLQITTKTGRVCARLEYVPSAGVGQAKRSKFGRRAAVPDFNDVIRDNPPKDNESVDDWLARTSKKQKFDGATDNKISRLHPTKQ